MINAYIATNCTVMFSINDVKSLNFQESQKKVQADKLYEKIN